MAYYEIISGK